jgi:cell division protein FtsL
MHSNGAPSHAPRSKARQSITMRNSNMHNRDEAENTWSNMQQHAQHAATCKTIATLHMISATVACTKTPRIATPRETQRMHAHDHAEQHRAQQNA